MKKKKKNNENQSTKDVIECEPRGAIPVQVLILAETEGNFRNISHLFTNDPTRSREVSFRELVVMTID